MAESLGVGLTVEQIRAALVRGDVSVRGTAEGVVAVKVAPFDVLAIQAGPFVECPLPLFLSALVGSACVGGPVDRPWPGSWWPVYGGHVWREPDED